MTPAIETYELAKTYVAGSVEVPAVRGVTLSVAPGRIYALLGPNGAGKTTTLSMLMTLLAPTSGWARVAGHDVVREAAEVRRRIGVTFQEVVLDQELTGRQVLDFHGQLYGLPRAQRQARIDDLAALVELADVLDRKAARYSGGMKRRLELARGLMTSPAVLFLDEPTQGLDPQNRAGIWQYVRRLRDEHGITLLLTTHSMEEAEALADTVGIIDHGQLVVQGSPAALISEMGADVVAMEGTGAADLLIERLGKLDFVQQVHYHAAQGSEPHRLQVGVDAGDRRLPEVVMAAAGVHFHVHAVSVARPSLADVFLSHTGHALRDQLDS